jgi:hypothetical protein
MLVDFLRGTNGARFQLLPFFQLELQRPVPRAPFRVNPSLAPCDIYATRSKGNPGTYCKAYFEVFVPTLEQHLPGCSFFHVENFCGDHLCLKAQGLGRRLDEPCRHTFTT